MYDCQYISTFSCDFAASYVYRYILYTFIWRIMLRILSLCLLVLYCLLIQLIFHKYVYISKSWLSERLSLKV